jgi:uncharacterized protein (TIGR03067 family)
MYPSLLLGVALVVAAPAPKTEAKKDPPTVVGTWVPESGTVGGKADRPPPGTTFEFTADGTLLIAAEVNPKPEVTSYTTDPKKEPAEIDVVGPGGKKEPPILGIYKIDGDTLTLAMSKDGTRPTKFESPAGSRVMVMTMKRAKKE